MAILMKADEEDFAKLFKEGISVDNISNEMGWPRKTVIQSLRRSGLMPIGQSQGILDSFTDEKLEQLSNDYTNLRMPIAALVEKYNLNGSVVLYQLLREMGIPSRTYSKPAMDDRKARMNQAIQLYLDRPDVSVSQICEEVGVSQPELSKELKRQHATLRNPLRAKPYVDLSK